MVLFLPHVDLRRVPEDGFQVFVPDPNHAVLNAVALAQPLGNCRRAEFMVINPNVS
jgi:hypothetical protein